MESSAADSSGSSPLPPEPPDPALDVRLPVVPPVPPVPPDPPPARLVCVFLRQISPFFTTPLQHKEPKAPMLCFLCASTRFTLKLLCSDAEHVSLKPPPLRGLTYYQQEAWIEILVARFLGLLLAVCKRTSLHCSSVQGLEDWPSNGEILAVVCLNAALITSVQPFGVQLCTAKCCPQSKQILHLKPWFHVVGPMFPCFKLSQGMVLISCWSESCFWDRCLLVEFIYLSRRSVCLWNQDVMLFLNGHLPLIEDVTNPLRFRFKLPLSQYDDVTFHSTTLLPLYEDVIWLFVFVAMDSNVSGLTSRLWWFASQHSAFSKRYLFTFESVAVAVSFPSRYVENFPTCSADGSWIVVSALVINDILQEAILQAPLSTLSTGISSLQCVSDFTVPFLTLRSGLDLIEITGFSTVRNLVTFVTPLSSFSKLCIIICLAVYSANDDVPKLCS